MMVWHNNQYWEAAEDILLWRYCEYGQCEEKATETVEIQGVVKHFCKKCQASAVNAAGKPRQD